MTTDDDDDGGADKSGDRRQRRQLRNISSKVGATLGISILFLTVYRLHTTRLTSNNGRRIVTPYSQRLGGRKPLYHDRPRPIEMYYSVKSVYRWADPRVLPNPPHFNGTNNNNDDSLQNDISPDVHQQKYGGRDLEGRHGKKRFRANEDYPWDNDSSLGEEKGPKVDYTKLHYNYPSPILLPPRGGSYPPMKPLAQLLHQWPQDNIDTPPHLTQPFTEHLQHFDFLDPVQMEAAVRYRDLEFPFKVVNVPEVAAAGVKWTDDYLTSHFDRNREKHSGQQRQQRVPHTAGHCQQSVDSFFAFFYEDRWNPSKFGDPPTVNNDFTFERFAKHARYADAVGLASNEEHFYWQAGVKREERNLPKAKWGMISRDLPSFSNPEPTFFGFNPEKQNGIQCRLGERGVAAATHYDAGRNMIAMITGAKRYILSPPNECEKLGIVGTKGHPLFRHSLLNFGHINALDSDDPEVEKMSSKEREWLKISKSAHAIETVLKAGEVLYLPSHWFHYIISLQKSAQCNTRSGDHKVGSPEWGGAKFVAEVCLKQSI